MSSRPSSATGRDHVPIAIEYAREVVDGSIVACRLTRLACQRFLRDLERVDEEDWPYRLDAGAANRFCQFAELFPHVKGPLARAKKKIELAPFQSFIFVNVFGWLRKSDGLRRFRRAYVEEPRKNGKSTGLATVALYMATEDGEPGAEVYCGATTEDQAWKVFEPAHDMAKRTPKFLAHYGVEVLANAIVVERTSSSIKTLIGNPGDGDNPSCAIIDEFHEHKTSSQYDTMTAGMGSRDQPLTFAITTSGFDLASPCYEHHQELVAVLEGSVTDETLFGVIYTYDKDEVSWDSDLALIQANPGIGYSTSLEYLQGQRARALRSTRYATTYKTKHLNEWCQARERYFDASAWNEAGDEKLKLKDFAGQPCIIGMDLASKRDLCALQIVFREGDIYTSFSRFYHHAQAVADDKLLLYQGWQDAGFLTVNEGNITDHKQIKRDLLELSKQHDVLELVYDATQASYLINELADDGFPLDRCVDHPQSTTKMSEPMKELDAAIVGGRVRHDGNEVQNWCIGNVVGKRIGNSLVRPIKEKDEAKIDGAVALIMAVSAWKARDAEPEAPTPWWELEAAEA